MYVQLKRYVGCPLLCRGRVVCFSDFILLGVPASGAPVLCQSELKRFGWLPRPIGRCATRITSSARPPSSFVIIWTMLHSNILPKATCHNLGFIGSHRELKPANLSLQRAMAPSWSAPAPNRVAMLFPSWNLMLQSLWHRHILDLILIDTTWSIKHLKDSFYRPLLRWKKLYTPLWSS